MTLFFSLSAFAYGYDEYGGNSGWSSGSFGSPVTNTGAMTSGGNFWSTNTSAMVSNNGVVTNNFDSYSPRYYVGSAGNTNQPGWNNAQSILDYHPKEGDVVNMYPFGNLETQEPKLDANGNVTYGFIITNNGSIMQPSNNYTGYTPQQLNNAIMGIGNYDPNPPVKPYFTYNNYNSSTNTNTVTVYQATPTGPVVVNTKVIVTYNEMPRVGLLGFTGPPSPDFYAAAQLSNKTSLTLAETVQYIEKYIDRVFTDIDGAGGRAAQIKAAIAKYATTLPEDQKPYAETIVIANRDTETVDDDGTIPTPIVPNKNYTFDENGNFKDSNTDGTGSIQIITKDGPKLPSQLDANDTSQRKILAKIAVFLAKKAGAPVGARFATGKNNDPKKLYSSAAAFTVPIPPLYTIVLNMRGGKYSTGLDNVYSFTSILQHELGHRDNFIHNIPSNVKTHADVYLDAMETIQFKKSPSDFKLSIVVSLTEYIWNMDKKGYELSDIIPRIVRFNSQAAYNGGYKIIAPTDPDNLSYITFQRGSLTSANLKVYDPVSQTEIPPIAFKIFTDEK